MDTPLDRIGDLPKKTPLESVSGKIIFVSDIREVDGFRPGDVDEEQYIVLADPSVEEGGPTVGVNVINRGKDLSQYKFHNVRLFGGDKNALKVDNYNKKGTGELKLNLRFTASGDFQDLGDAAPSRGETGGRGSQQAAQRTHRAAQPAQQPAQGKPTNKTQAREATTAQAMKTIGQLSVLSALCKRQALIQRHCEYEAQGVIQGASSLAASLFIDARKMVSFEHFPHKLGFVDLSLPEGVLSHEEQNRILAAQDADFERWKTAEPRRPVEPPTPGPEAVYEPPTAAQEEPVPAYDEPFEDDSDIPF